MTVVGTAVEARVCISWASRGGAGGAGRPDFGGGGIVLDAVLVTASRLSFRDGLDREARGRRSVARSEANT